MLKLERALFRKTKHCSVVLEVKIIFSASVLVELTSQDSMPYVWDVRGDISYFMCKKSTVSVQ